MEEGIASFEAALEQRDDKSIPTDYLIDLLTAVLKSNVFQFDNKLYLQQIGTAMGPAVSPSYANIFMGPLDEKMKALAREIETDLDPIYAFKRFLDDIFMIWVGSPSSLFQFLEKINDLHPTMKFTYSMTNPYPCSLPLPHDGFCQTPSSIPFLDTQVSVQNGQLVTDLYRKETDRCQYLLPSSCHPQHITKNIPYSLAYRLVRICSQRETLLKRFEELKTFLLSRDYPPSIIDSALTRASLVDRNEALMKVQQTPNNRTVFALDYHPALPSISNTLKSSWNLMVKDPYLKEVFPKPPMVAYRKAPKSSLRELLVQAKVPPPPSRYTRRVQTGMKKCNKSACPACPFVTEGNLIKSSASNFKVKVNEAVNCNTTNVVYVITCLKSSCLNIQYVGETKRRFRDRFSEHIGYVRNELTDHPTGNHFNLPGHNLGHMEATIVEHCKYTSDNYRRTREAEFISRFNTKNKGLNKKR